MSNIELFENNLDLRIIEQLITKKLEQGVKEHKLVNIDYLKELVGRTDLEEILQNFANINNYVFLQECCYKEIAYLDTKPYSVDYEKTTYEIHKAFMNSKGYQDSAIQVCSYNELTSMKFVVNTDTFIHDNSIDKINIMTGYTHDNIFEHNFNSGVKQTLQNEIKALIPKIQYARESDNTGTYKNLILAFKEVLELYNGEETH